MQRRNLPAQLRADGAAAAGDQHGLAPVKGHGLGILHLNGIPEQQILNPEVTQGALGRGLFLRTGGIIVHLHGTAGILIAFIELLLALHRQIRQGNDNFPDLHPFQQVGSAVILRIDRHTIDRLPHLLRVGIYKAHRLIPGAGIAEEFIRKSSAHITGAHDGHLHLIQLAEGVALNILIGISIAIGVQQLVAIAGQQRHQQDGHSHDQMHTDAQIDGKPYPPQEHQQHVGHEVRDHNGQISLYVGVAPNVAVYAKDDAPGHNRDHQGQHTGQIDLPVEYNGVQPQYLHQIGHIIHANDDGNIYQHQLHFSSAKLHDKSIPLLFQRSFSPPVLYSRFYSHRLTRANMVLMGKNAPMPRLGH